MIDKELNPQGIRQGDIVKWYPYEQKLSGRLYRVEKVYVNTVSPITLDLQKKVILELVPADYMNSDIVSTRFKVNIDTVTLVTSLRRCEAVISVDE